MAAAKGKGRGFGSMDQEKQREIARQGGRASAQSNTSNRGFASMDKAKQREISSQGGKASQSGRNPRGATGRNQQDPSALSDQHEAKLGHETSEKDLKERDLNSLEDEDEITGDESRLAAYSETDEDEDEGVGDGQMGRSEPSRGFDEEG